MSRLTALANGAAVETSGLAAFNFRDMGGWHLLTNDWGQFLMLSTADFERFMAGKVEAGDPLYPELESRGFMKARLDFKQLAANYVKKNSFQWFPGPSLHMIVVTLRCNQKCQYCHSSVVDPSRTDTDMDIETARKTVDFIFSTPNPTICIEFQGGEPLLNWPVVKFITEYAQAKAKAGNRKLLMALVCNFTLMTEDKLDFLFDHHVSICTSLDGPAELHNQNRPFLGGGEAQQKVVYWLEKIQERCNSDVKKKYYLPGALMTTTRFSMDYGPQIVDLYVKLGLEQIFLRPLSPIGYAKRVWKDVGYAPEEFVRFYEETLDYIIDLNISGKSDIMERMALILLTKIVKGEDPGFMDLRSPAGAVLGCLAYNYNGEIFVSDEGRMVDHQGDPIFRVGDVAKSDWASVIDHPTTRACVTASTLDNQPMCQQCAYKPYCGAEPVFHYETQKSVFGQMPTSGWCISHMGVFDVIFRKLRDPRSRKVMDKWLERDQCRWQESGNVPAGEPEVVL
ncbi:MAG: His-Xaa-Ser system radical SAM maturase HxsB [Elusimicrobia bacterium CG11_big_fil_rev_8_21_14_0_20_64_6]|nr:MAG: His-Xaa-Ser system radical SAM maturase HxsB [Elusimicrobia bacterium CG11_big_fil_rev_8_21_14_0_20_64_6]